MPKPLVFLILAAPLVGAYALYAAGIVAIYQASRVLNLAHGAMAVVPAYVVYTLVELWHVPLAIAVPLGIVFGALLGVGVERILIRRLRSVSPTAQTVGTVAALGVMIALSAKIWGTSALRAPAVFPEGSIEIGASSLRYGQIGLFVVSLFVTAGLYVLIQKTWFGLAMRGAAENRRAAALMGVDPELTTAAAWALGGGLAGLAGILLSAVTILDPFTLSASVLPAFVAALIGGLERLPTALVGAGIVGVVIGFVPVLADLPGLSVVLGQIGGVELVLAVTAIVVMALRGQRFSGSDARATGGIGAAGRGEGPSLVRLIPARLVLVVLALWIWLPFVPFEVQQVANQALVFALVAASLVLLTGWVGQISLAHAAFVGIGAFGSVLLANRAGVAFPFSLPIAALGAAAAATVLGVVALRVRGLYLAVATLIFGWMADNYLFSQPWFAGVGGSATASTPPIGFEGGYPFFDFTDPRILYTVILAVTGAVALALSNMRRSKTGRALFAIRGSETAAASLGIDVTRYKLLAFALSGAIAGMAGNLVLVGQRTIVPSQFAFTVSLLYLSIAVVAGLGSIGGVFAAGVLFAGLDLVFFRVEALRGWLDVVSAGLLAVVLLLYPRGLKGLEWVLARPLARLRDAVRARMGAPTGRLGGAMSTQLDVFRGLATRVRRRETDPAPAEEAAAVEEVPTDEDSRLRSLLEPFGARLRAVWDSFDSLRSGRGAGSDDDTADTAIPDRDVLAAEGVTVRFGGLVAVEDASLALRPGEIVGLIGPNGAGKTTLFNAIAGFVRPETGRIRIRGEDVSDLPVHERAKRGMGRTFQALQLVPQLTVHENLMIATHNANRTGLASHVFVTRPAMLSEAAALGRVREVVELLGLHDQLDAGVGDLPFGELRMVELARAVVTGSPVVMLDEPASGLDNAETDRFAELLRTLRRDLDLSILLIEHDVRMVMALVDRLYVLDQGRIIAEGAPEVVGADPAVVAAYLGRPEQAGDSEAVRAG